MTDIRDFINTTGAEELRASQRFDTDPRWHDRPVDPPSPTRRSKIVARWVVGIVVFGIALGMVAAGRASERNPQTVFVIWNEATDKQYHDHEFKSPTACSTDITLAKNMPDGLRLSCRKVTR